MFLESYVIFYGRSISSLETIRLYSKAVGKFAFEAGSNGAYLWAETIKPSCFETENFANSKALCNFKFYSTDGN